MKEWQGNLFDVGDYEEDRFPPYADTTIVEAELWTALDYIQDDPFDPRVKFLAYKILKIIEREEL